ncbi:MAG: methylenetetrahydrofolate reductase C-terminal domain-containing protein [Candidatus Helarchaeota archaeon]|nr:methylenetetrahydrofolate reductase C-terminal domain-containing protein [Candidatus Helarchaeota archaeon]
MIITEQKNIEEIMDNLEKYKRIIVVGCDLCATACQTGGEEQVKQMIEHLKENWDGQVLNSLTIESTCDVRLTKRDLKKIQEDVENADAFLVMSCGIGCQTVAEITTKPIIPTNNTMFIGQTERIGKYHEFCKACGDCLLAETGGICPITRCAKSLLNGPCGGVVDGKCEVGNYVNDCAWNLIYNRLKELDQLAVFEILRFPKNYVISNNPRNIDKTRRPA